MTIEARTVGELIDALQKLPPDMRVCGIDRRTDRGMVVGPQDGYDLVVLSDVYDPSASFGAFRSQPASA